MLAIRTSGTNGEPCTALNVTKPGREYAGCHPGWRPFISFFNALSLPVFVHIKRNFEVRDFIGELILNCDITSKSYGLHECNYGHNNTGCCPNQNSFERSLKRFYFINLGEAEEMRFQLSEPEGRVLKSPEASLRFI